MGKIYSTLVLGALTGMLLNADVSWAQRGRAGGRLGSGIPAPARRSDSPDRDRSPERDRTERDRTAERERESERERSQDRDPANRQERPAAGDGVRNADGDRRPDTRPSEMPNRPAQAGDLNNFLGLPRNEAVNIDGTRDRTWHDVHYAPNNQPFTAAWYADHPNAWQAAHPHADAWAVASWGNVQRWLGLGAQPVYYQPAAVVAVPGTVEVTVGDASATEESSEEAQQLVARQPQTPDDQSEWMPLGVFSLTPVGQTQANQMVQLSVSRDGIVRGSYFDVVTDSSHTIQGSVDRQTQKVAWKAGSDRSPVFETTVASLTQPQSTVTLHFADGYRQNWQMSQMPPAASE